MNRLHQSGLVAKRDKSLLKAFIAVLRYIKLGASRVPAKAKPSAV